MECMPKKNAWADIQKHFRDLADTRTFQQRLRCAAFGVATFLVLVTIGGQIGGSIDAMHVISVLCLGLITLWPIVFKRSAFLTALVQIGTLVATFILEAGCTHVFSAEWCEMRGYSWLYYLAIATLYALVGTFLLRGSIKKETWKNGAAFGSMAALPYVLLLSLVDRTGMRMPPVLSTEGAMFQVTLNFIVPVLLVGWLVWQMNKEKRNKTWKQVFAL